MIELAVVNATLRSEEGRIDLPPREFAVLLALALAPRVWPSYRLIPLLWPGASVSDCSCLKVYVHRLRRRLGRDVILSTNRGYELDRSVVVDLWEMEALLRKPELQPEDRETLRRFVLEAHAANRDFLTRWPWFAGTEGLIQQALSAIYGRLEHESVPPAPARRRRTWLIAGPPVPRQAAV